jgi:TatD DNase family protein
VILHARGCEKLVLDICIHKKVDKAIFHCYTGSLEIAKRIVDAGYYISFSGIITFKNSALDNCVASVPLASLLIETDSPYLAPVPHRGKTNEPAYVVCVGQHIANVKQCNEQIIADASTKNFIELFTRDSDRTTGIAS